MSLPAGPLALSAGVQTNLPIPNGPWVQVVLANLTAMPVVVDAAAWLSPFTAEVFSVDASEPYVALVPVSVGGTTTGHILATFYDPHENGEFGSRYPLLIPLTTAE